MSDEYKLWSKMTEEERAPILMAHKMGLTIQWYYQSISAARQKWEDDIDDEDGTSSFQPNTYDLAYRIKPTDE